MREPVEYQASMVALPPKRREPKVVISIRVSPGTLERLDRAAERAGYTRSDAGGTLLEMALDIDEREQAEREQANARKK
jgi:hypothetical protein